MGCGASRSRVYAEGGLVAKVEKLDEQVQALSATVEKLDQQLQTINGAAAGGGGGGGGAKLQRSKTKANMQASGRICSASAQERAAFLEDRWLPFVHELQDEMRASRARAIGGFSPEEILSPQSKMQGWSDRCLELTAEWHGRPNLSLMYEFLVEAATLDPSTPYVSVQPETAQIDERIDNRSRKQASNTQSPMSTQMSCAMS